MRRMLHFGRFHRKNWRDRPLALAVLAVAALLAHAGPAAHGEPAIR